MAAAPDHRQPRAGRPAQGGLGLRPPDRARGARARRGSFPPGSLAGHAAIGELALDGRLRPVPGALAAAEGARRNGSRRLVCAAESGAEVALAGIEPVPVQHLVEAVEYFRGERDPPAPEPAPRRSQRRVPDLGDVRGQERARRVLEIAAAGRHNLLLAGPPGIGKTMLARRLPGILPAARAGGGARGDADPLDRRPAAERRRPPARRRRSARRTTPPRRRRSSAAARRPGRARRRSRITACCCSTSCRSSRGRCSRRCGSRSRTARSRSHASAGGPSSRRGSSSSGR